MKTKEQILKDKFQEHGIEKAWKEESKNAVLDAMEEYAISKLNFERADGYYWVRSIDKLHNILIWHIAHFTNGGWYIINHEGKLNESDFDVIEIDEHKIKGK